MEINKTSKTITISQNTGITMSLAFMIMIAGALITGVSWINTTQNRIDNLTISVQGQRVEINQLKTDSTNSQIKFTEIQTQLKSIDTTLLEIKDKLK